MADDQDFSSAPYLDQDSQYGRLLQNLINPPAVDAAEVQSPTRATNYAQDTARTTQVSVPPAVTPSSAPSPAVVSPSGNPPQKGWADYVREGLSGATRAQANSQQSVDQLQNQDSAATRNAPVESRVQQLSTPTPYRDPKTGQVLDSAQQYKPTGWQRFGRGLKSAALGLVTGGIPGAAMGAIDPTSIRGGTAYGAPNRAYQTTEANRQAQLGAATQQLGENLAEEKADTERLGKTASEQRAAATGSLDIAKAATAQQLAETGARGTAGVDAQMSKQGMKPSVDANGVRTGAYEPDPTSPQYQKQQADSDLARATISLRKAQTDAKNADPNTPAGRQAIAVLNAAIKGHDASMLKSQAMMLNATAGNLGVDSQGNQIEGSATSSTGKPIGSRFAQPYIKQEGKTAQFNDVFGATDNIEKTAERLVKAGGALNSSGVAAAIADPKSTSAQWAQGEFANSNLTPEERDYVTNVKAYKENLQALRQSVGGGVSDAQVNRLMEMAPGASTPDLDYLKRQTGQIRQTANRLAEGMPKMKGGHAVKGGPTSTPSNSSDPFAQFGGKAR